MPLSKYYGGKGEQVMSKMKKKYGKEKGEDYFYATHNKYHSGYSAKDQALSLKRGKKK